MKKQRKFVNKAYTTSLSMPWTATFPQLSWSMPVWQISVIELLQCLCFNKTSSKYLCISCQCIYLKRCTIKIQSYRFPHECVTHSYICIMLSAVYLKYNLKLHFQCCWLDLNLTSKYAISIPFCGNCCGPMKTSVRPVRYLLVLHLTQWA